MKRTAAPGRAEQTTDWLDTAVGVVVGVVLLCCLVGLAAHPHGPAALRTVVAATVAVLALVVSRRRRRPVAVVPITVDAGR